MNTEIAGTVGSLGCLAIKPGAARGKRTGSVRIRVQIGHCAWNELSSSDPEAAKAFYHAQLGWAKNGEMDIGAMGKCEFLKASGGRFGLGAVMPKMPEMPVSMWTFYFRVADVDAAVSTIKTNGGTILQEPMEIPGGEFAINAMDPLGGAFGLVGSK